MVHRSLKIYMEKDKMKQRTSNIAKRKHSFYLLSAYFYEKYSNSLNI